MNTTHVSTRLTTWRVRIFITVICLVAVMFIYPASVQAGNIVHTRAVPAGQTIDDDVFLTGDSPNLDGIVNGDVFIVGSNVTITGQVNGSIFVVAKTITLPGQVSGNMYSAALELTQQADSQIDRSLYVLVLSLITETGSTIGRDLNTVALSANLQGETERDTSAIIGPWEIFKILRDFFNQNIKGYLPSQTSSLKNNQELVSFSSRNPYTATMQAADTTEYTAMVNWLLAASKSFVSLLIVGLLALWLFPRLFPSWIEQVKKRPMASAGYGTIVLINGYLIPVLGLILVVGLFLSLIYLSLPYLAWFLLLMALGMLLTFLALFLVAAVFLSKVIVAYLVGAFILSHTASGALRYRVVPLLVGLLIFVPLVGIPYVGFLIGLVVTLLGLGSMWLAWRQASRSAEAKEEVQAPVSAESNNPEAVEVENLTPAEVDPPAAMEVNDPAPAEANSPVPAEVEAPASKTKSRKSNSNKGKS